MDEEDEAAAKCALLGPAAGTAGSSGGPGSGAQGTSAGSSGGGGGGGRYMGGLGSAGSSPGDHSNEVRPGGGAQEVWGARGQGARTRSV